MARLLKGVIFFLAVFAFAALISNLYQQPVAQPARRITRLVTVSKDAESLDHFRRGPKELRNPNLKQNDFEFTKVNVPDPHSVRDTTLPPYLAGIRNFVFFYWHW